MRKFLFLLCLSPVAFAVSVSPILGRVLAHVSLAISTSSDDPWSRRWWDWPGSWIIIAGPFGRWVVGIVLGFWILRSERKTHQYPGSMIEEPHMRLVIVAGLAFLLSVFAITMALITSRNIHRGQTMFDSLRTFKSSTYKKYICIPDQRLSPSAPGPVFSVNPVERIYDVGSRENWRAIWYQHCADGYEYMWPKINPDVLRRLRRPL